MIFAIEGHLDMMAAKLGVDPLDMRLLNGVGDGDLSPLGKGKLRNVGLEKTLHEVRKHWKQEKPGSRLNRGRGIACGPWHANMVPGGEGLASSACVKLNEDGTAVLVTGGAEVGGGQHSILSQIVAEELGVPFEHVSVIAADTDATPYEMSIGGSMATLRIGNSVRLAAEDAREQVLKLAEEKLEANIEDLQIQGGQVYAKGSPSRAISLSTLANAAMLSSGGPILGTGLRQREQRMASVKAAGGVIDGPSYNAHLAEVEVDVETGQVHVLGYVAAHDVGFAISPANVEGQIEGGVFFGLGYAMMEEMPLKKGYNLVTSFHDYRMPTALDMPSVSAPLVEVPSHFGPYGAKAVGEPATAPVAAALANAIYDAVGVRITELPITPERVVNALKGG